MHARRGRFQAVPQGGPGLYNAYSPGSPGNRMIRLPVSTILSAVARNVSKRLGVTAWVHQVRGGMDRGGQDWSDRSIESHAAHVVEVFQTMHAAIGDVRGKTGAELGPGEDVAVAYCFLKAGAKKMYTVERFASVKLDERAIALFRAVDLRLKGLHGVKADDIATLHGGQVTLDPARLEHKIGRFEARGLPESVDFIYSNDVMEHVDDPATIFRCAFDALKPGGKFVNNIDLAGHNAFSNPSQPLDFLTCPDWLWSLMFSHIVTTNRVRYSEFLRCASAAGFEVEKEDVLVRAEEAYLQQVRPDFIERYRRLMDDDLGVIQSRLLVVRPGART